MTYRTNQYILAAFAVLIIAAIGASVWFGLQGKHPQTAKAKHSAPIARLNSPKPSIASTSVPSSPPAASPPQPVTAPAAKQAAPVVQSAAAAHHSVSKRNAARRVARSTRSRGRTTASALINGVPVAKAGSALTDTDRGMLDFITKSCERQMRDPNMPPQLRETVAQCTQKVLDIDHRREHALLAIDTK